MNFLSYLVILTVVFSACCQDDRDTITEERDEDVKDSSREGKQLRDPVERGGWRAVENREWQNSDEWIPRDSPSIISPEIPEKPTPRRRRIRKRKRRPPLIVLNPDESEDYLPRRRRIRPQTLEDANNSWSEIEEEAARRPSNRRRIIPVYAPAEEIVEIESPSAVLQFEESTEEPQKPLRVYEKVRDPFTALEEVEAKARLKKKQETEQNKDQETTTVSHLKALLKQSGGQLSLSELLQQKNLSLNDLLKGKHQAISALTEKPEINTEAIPEEVEVESVEEPKYKITETSTSTETSTIVTDSKLEIEESFPTKDTNRNYEILDGSFETMPSKEELEAQRRGVLKLHSSFEHKKITTVKNYEVVTEPTTEKRIFVPSHPKYYTSFNYKPDMTRKVAESIMKPTTKFFAQTTRATPVISTRKNNFSSKYLDFRAKYVSLKPKVKTLPMTSAKLNRLSSKQSNASEELPATTALPPKAFKIDLKDMFVISEVSTKNETKPKDDGPFRMSIDINILTNLTTTEKSATDYHQTFKKDLMKELENSENEVINGPKTTMKYLEKIKPTSAREEIMEILRDHMSKQNLSRILQLRNMTIEELVAQRERGSSQLHLADIFHNQTREPEPPSEPYVGHIGAVPSFFDRKPKTIPNPTEIQKYPEGSKYFASVRDLKPLELNFDNKPVDLPEDIPTKSAPVIPAKEKYTVTSFPTYKIEMEKIIKNNQPPPFQLSVWRSLYPNLYTGNSENSQQIEELDALKATKAEDLLQHEVHRVEDIENTISEAVNDQLNIDVNENNYEDEDGFIHLPSGVKSAIIASAAIVGISLLVFLTIFIIFKWSHKQKKRLCYSDSLSCSRIKSPILETRPKRTIRTIMSETLGRKKKYCNVYPQSMSDYIWENDKKPFQ